jgi:beta-fructofuranosidase
MVELERPLDMLAGQPIELTVWVDGTVCEVYAGGRVAMSARLYDLPAGLWGAFVQEGVARFDATHLATPGR